MGALQRTSPRLPDRCRHAVLLAAAFACVAAAPLTAPPPAVSVAAAVTGEIVETVAVYGSLAAREEVLVNPQVDGLAITAITAEEGQWVKKGQVLATLQSDTLLANLAQDDAQLARAEASAVQALAQIAQARATQTLAALSLERGRKLAETGTTSRETVEQRQAASDVAAAQVVAAQGALAAADADRALAAAQRSEIALRLARTEIRAPVAGVVSRRTARLGAVVGMTGDPLFRIVEDGTLELDASVPETTLARLRPGQPAVIEVTGHSRQRRGLVRLVSPEVAAVTRLGRVRITLGDLAVTDSADLALGGFARARVEVARATGVLVPLSAVLTRAGGAEVQVVIPSANSADSVTPGATGAESAASVAPGATGAESVTPGANGADSVTPGAIGGESVTPGAIGGESDTPVTNGAEGVVVTRPVHVGLRDDRSAQILDGVAAGERVVSVSGTFVRNGDRVIAVAAP